MVKYIFNFRSSGESDVTFTAEATLDGRTAEVLIKSGKTQRVNIIQGLARFPKLLFLSQKWS